MFFGAGDVKAETVEQATRADPNRLGRNIAVRDALDKLGRRRGRFLRQNAGECVCVCAHECIWSIAWITRVC
jgi:hypothetical protein